MTRTASLRLVEIGAEQLGDHAGEPVPAGLLDALNMTAFMELEDEEAPKAQSERSATLNAPV